jgi:hypothetical protein
MFKKKTDKKQKAEGNGNIHSETIASKINNCDHEWIFNDGEGKRYICKKCGEQSD